MAVGLSECQELAYAIDAGAEHSMNMIITVTEWFPRGFCVAFWQAKGKGGYLLTYETLECLLRND